MKRLPMTWGRWAGLTFGAILPTVSITPWLLIVVMYLTLVLVFIFSPDPKAIFSGSLLGRILVGGLTGLLLSLIIVIGIGALVSLWWLILFGPEQINQRRGLRRFAILTILPGLVFGSFCTLHWFFVGRHHSADFKNLQSLLPELLLSVGIPGGVLAGLWHLPSLLRRKQT